MKVIPRVIPHGKHPFILIPGVFELIPSGLYPVGVIPFWIPGYFGDSIKDKTDAFKAQKPYLL